MTRISVLQILDKKKKHERVVMLTAYDYPLAVLLDRCGIDIILVGDSLANVVLGLESTREVDMEIMLHHTKAVNRGVKQAMLVGDMPYGSYQSSESQAVRNARRFLEEGGCSAVKVEWFENCLQIVKALVRAGISVMGHVGLTPQAVTSPEGFKVQGREAVSAQNIFDQAKELEKQGCFSLVIECVPDRVAELITRGLKIPTIGIGSGPFCDGQVLVTHDLLGLFERYHPKFVKCYQNLGQIITQGVSAFRDDVHQGRFPDSEHSYAISDQEFEKLKILLSSNRSL